VISRVEKVLAQLAAEAAKRIKFKPKMENGVPINSVRIVHLFLLLRWLLARFDGDEGSLIQKRIGSWLKPLGRIGVNSEKR